MQDDYDPEAPDAFDLDDKDQDNLVTCNECGSEVYADSDRCPKCGYWIVDDEVTRKIDLRRPYRHTKIIAASILLLLAFLFI